MPQRSRPLVACLLVLLLAPAAPAQFLRRRPPDPVLHGQLVDHTANHGADRRIWSQALCARRDLYVYLPPGFDPARRYPLILWLHGVEDDEKGLPREPLEAIDRAMAAGCFPKAIVAVPDGNLTSRRRRNPPHSAFLNSRAGPFEDYLLQDVYAFLAANYPLHARREAHVLAGVSLGGAAAFHHAIKARDQFGVVVGVFPPLNTRWLDCHGHYFADFDPDCWGWRTNYHLGLKPVGKFYGGLVPIPMGLIVRPLYGRGQQVIPQMSRDNPLEMLDTYGLRGGELEMLVAYGKRDEFNIDAQVESFLYRAAELGIHADTLVDPRGRHNLATAQALLPAILDWLAPRLAPYSPP